MHRRHSFAILMCLALSAPATLGAAEVEIDSATFGGLRARAIGPAVMSGRISAIDAVAADPVTIWVGSASGGLWKSDDAGTVFEPVFDDHNQSIGAIRVDPSSPDTVWVGTGETWVRNSVSVGDGVYRTTDGGDTWQHLGLEATERIAKIEVHPAEPDTVYVCATGQLWSANPERGVYKTTDGGATWELILSVDEDTGCADLDMDPQEPRILYAAMWQFRRAPDFFTSGGPGSGLYRTLDGGETWTELTEGLPEGDKGRIALAIAPSRPSVLYATVEAETTALYRSDDLGNTWRMTDDSTNVQMRPFYFSELVVDPTDHDRVYKPGFTLTVSTDGGDSFSGLFGAGFSMGAVHPDHHALWIDPRNPHWLVLGTDGGAYISEDRAKSWRHVRSLPVSQFYHVSHDTEWPYNVYGGLQDNGSWKGPSRSPGGISSRDWQVVGSGDGFWAFADPDDPNILYVEYQGGQLSRVDVATGESKSIKPFARDGEEELRFNWNTPIHLSPSRPGTLYYGSQYLHFSTDRGDSWTTISPDLTTDDPARQRQADSGGLTIDNTTAENNTTIYAISESPLDPQVVWVGSDDGLVHVTRNGGGDWTRVSDSVPGVPEGTWVSSVSASPHAASSAFVTFDGHRAGDMATYLFRTDDFGASWQPLASEEITGYAWVVKQDPVNPDLLYAGTELGLYLSLDGGGHWARFAENLPEVAVHDLAIHPTEHDLIIATHGRGVYIIDDLSAIRALGPEVMGQSVALLPSRPAPQVLSGGMSWFGSDDEFVGSNPDDAATINYWLKRRHLFGDLRIEVYDADGELLTTLPGKKRRGINRVGWPMRLKAPTMPPAKALVFAFQGPRVPEGEYTFKLVKGDEVLEGTVELVPDPRNPHPREDRLLQQETALRAYHLLDDLTFLADSVTDLRDQARDRAAKLPKKEHAALVAFADSLDELHGTLVVADDGGWMAGREELRERLGNLFGEIVAYDGRPSGSQLERVDGLAAELERKRQEFESTAREVDDLNRILARRDLEPLAPLTREAWQARQEAAGGSSGFGSRAMWGLLLGL
ncbi:MAG TPA: glycosyl hydrolase [Methylomirabilota bacterium]|nr:glycosyl hydrolase [Methylomirabilota bacterium]